MIIVVSALQDEHARAVLEKLKAKQAHAELLDLSEFPTESRLTLDFSATGERDFQLAKSAQEIDFSSANVIWWRRPQHFKLDPEITSAEDQQFAYTECYSAFSGLWLTQDKFWINHPTRDEEASKKVYQLRVAQDLGFTIPDTCITNDVRSARHFIHKYASEAVIYKAFAGTEQAWRETRVLKQNELELIDKVKYAPVIFQECIPGIDLRITVVGDKIFTAAINAQNTSYTVDFRMVMNESSIEAFELPGGLQQQLLSYMDALGLQYGAIDMRLTPEGKYVFLEINPSGQWLFVEQGTGLPISEALVDLMIENDFSAVNAPSVSPTEVRAV